MDNGKGEAGEPLDPSQPFREVRDAYLDAMAKAMTEAVNTESYAQAPGAMLNAYLTASAPFREAFEASMVRTLQRLSMPSRQEFADLAGRFTNLEIRLDDMDAKLDEIVKALHIVGQKGTTAAAKPAGAPSTEPASGVAGAQAEGRASAKATRGTRTQR